MSDLKNMAMMGKRCEPNHMRAKLTKADNAEAAPRNAPDSTVGGQMIEGIAHDIRNVLAVIEAALRLAEQNAHAPDKVLQCIAGARDGAARGLLLTSELLAFAKQQDLELLPADANELLRQHEAFLKLGAGPKLRVVMRLAPGIPKCVVDPAQFNAAILNLVINARDATLNGGEVVISTDRYDVPASPADNLPGGPYVRVRVKDNGQGISPEKVNRIFDRFFTTKGGQGTGLGLPQVRALMRRTGGHLEVASEPGIGTTFDLLFPTEPRTPAKSRTPPMRAKASKGLP
jgi:signal transduction histidine kinase